MAARLTKKQQTQLTEKLTGIIQKNNALQLRLSADSSVNEMNVNQISGALNRIHDQAIGKELPTEITIPVKQLGSGDPSPDNIRPIVGYKIDGIGTIYEGVLNIETGVLTLTYTGVDLGTLEWAYVGDSMFRAPKPNGALRNYSGRCSKYLFIGLAGSPGDKQMSSGGSGLYVVVKDTAYTDAATFKTAISGVQLVYELETPETYILTPEQMIQLLDQL